MPETEKFEQWVFEEVLPTIHKTGGYAQGLAPLMELLQQQTAMLMQAVAALGDLTRRVDERGERSDGAGEARHDPLPRRNLDY